MALRKLGFLTIGLFDEADPRRGHESTLEIIELGTAVTPLGWENPLRLAEDWATVDILSGGRLNPGMSVGPPMRWDDVKAALYPDTADAEDFTYQRVARLLAYVRGEPVTDFRGREGFEEFSDRVQPHSPGRSVPCWGGLPLTGRPSRLSLTGSGQDRLSRPPAETMNGHGDRTRHAGRHRSFCSPCFFCAAASCAAFFCAAGRRLS